MNTIFWTAPGSFYIENGASSRIGDLSYCLSCINNVWSSCLRACNIYCGNCGWDATYLQSISMIARYRGKRGICTIYELCRLADKISHSLRILDDWNASDVRLNMASLEDWVTQPLCLRWAQVLKAWQWLTVEGMSFSNWDVVCVCDMCGKLSRKWGSVCVLRINFGWPNQTQRNCRKALSRSGPM
jgi:hypothetical protein